MLLRRSVLFGCAIAIAIGVVAPSPARAADNGQWSVFPGQPPGTPPDQFGLDRIDFQPVLTPGETHTEYVAVTNQTDRPLSLMLYGADGFVTTDGGFSIERPTDNKDALGAWIRLPYTNVTLEPRTESTIPFEIVVPADAAPGELLGGIVAQSTEGITTEQEGGRVTVFPAVGARMFGRVEGELTPKLAISDIHIATSGMARHAGGPSDTTVEFTVTNEGNQILEPEARVELSSLVGEHDPVTVEFPGEGVLPPGQSVTLTAAFDGVWAIGPIEALVEVTSPETSATATARIWAVPWLVVAIVGFVMLVLAWLWWRRRRARRQAVPATEERSPELVSVGSGNAEDSER